jgi:hypothetical protein
VLVLDFIDLVADAKRKHVWTSQHSVDFHIAAVETAGPAAVNSI